MGVGVGRVLVDALVAVAVEGSDGCSLDDAQGVVAVAEGVVVEAPAAGQLVDLVDVAADVGVEGYGPVLVLQGGVVEAELEALVAHAS